MVDAGRNGWQPPALERGWKALCGSLTALHRCDESQITKVEQIEIPEDGTM